ncbi:PAS domain S-box protein [Aquabacterium sp. OR-4]|uniref:PAS domain S-box protein n=1 Tax=Aquabacterium sp. OR-4 TaxID=2978127 RepID=UPI0021B24B83|nr:PAS domain S-box protein [Aquabacterium sp. OR-4]MDT7833965.1 PAS domain S-box protein [Aquabacterium sp. OR-4]
MNELLSAAAIAPAAEPGLDDAPPLGRAERLGLLQAALDQGADPVFGLARDGHLVYANQAACRWLGCAPDSLPAHAAAELSPAWSTQALARDWAAWRTAGAAVLESTLHDGDGRLRPVEMRLSIASFEGRELLFALVHDISLRQRTQQRDQRRLVLMESLALGAPLDGLLERLCREHEQQHPGSLCAVMLRDDEAGHLIEVAGPSLPAEWRHEIARLPISADGPPCAAAAATGQRVVVDDIHRDASCAPVREAAARLGLAACWSEPIRGAQGRVLGTLAVYRRHTGRPGADEADDLAFAVQLAATALSQGHTTRQLAASERRLKDLLRALPDLVWMKDTQGVYRACNAAFERLLDRPEAEIVGRSDADFVDAESAAAMRAHDAAVIATGRPDEGERWLHFARDGHRGLYEIVQTPLFDADGQPTGLLGVARDVTLTRQGAQAITDQHRLVDTMFSQTTDAIVLLDPVSLNFVNFNDAASAGLGYAREAFARLRPMDLQAELDENAVRAVLRRAMAGEVVRFDTRHRRADGGQQIAALTLRRLQFAGRMMVSAVWRDITDSRLHEVRIQRLNQAYAMLSRVNEAIVRIRDSGTRLFNEVCRIAVEVGGFRLAWVGGLDPGGGGLFPITHSGTDEHYLDQLRLPSQQPPGPAAQAVAGGRVCVFNDIAESPASKLRESALAHGYRAFGAFPIPAGGTVRHALMVYSDVVGHFDDEQITLFTRLAQDLGFALDFNAVEQAQRQEQRFREQLVDSVAGLFFALDRQGRPVLWNRRFEEVTGYAAAEIAQRPATDYFDADERVRMAESIAEVFDRGEGRVEASLVSRDGRRTPYLFVSRRIDRSPEPLLVGTGTDISDRVRSDRELALYRQQLEVLVATRTAELETVNARLAREDQRLRAMLALSQKASAQGEQELLQGGLEVACRQTASAVGCLAGVEDGALLPGLQAWAGQPPPADAPTPVDSALWQAALAQRRTVVLEGEAARSAGLLPGASRLLCMPVVDDGQVRLLLCVADKPGPYDAADERALALIGGDLLRIVRRRRIEIALEQAKQAADAANQAKGAFLANMSHEIRTPMNAIVGFAHLLRRDPLTPRQVDHLAKITDAGQHLLQVINDILDFSKIEAHKITLDDTDFVLRESVERVTAMLVDRARAKQVAISLEMPGCPAVVRGDRLRLEQVLLNLVGNAVKFTQRGRVMLRIAALSDDGQQLLLRFEVEDTGIGMREDQIPHLFEAFEQADASTTRRFGGTGLGLAISKRLTELMHGRIGVRSQPGRGSLFWFELPLQRGQALPVADAGAAAAARPALLPPAPDDAALLRSARVLLAEDNAINQEVASTLLGALGVTVDVAGNGEEAVRLVRELPHGPYDLVLMDVQMPVMDGLRATGQIRAAEGATRLPIVAMTANAFEEDRLQCLAAGMDDYLAKPVEPQQLRQCLLSWLRRRRLPLPAAGAGPDDQLRTRLAAVPGLDLALGLTRVNGNWALYLRALRLFRSHHGPDLERLAQPEPMSAPMRVAPVAAGPADAAAPAAWHGLRRLAHSVAGAAATLGAGPLQRQAQALEQALEQALDLPRALVAGTLAEAAASPAALPATPPLALQQALADELGRLFSALDEALAEAAAPPASPAPDWAQVLGSLVALQPLLVSHDTSAGERFDTERGPLLAAFGEAAERLGRHIHNFSFSEALLVLAPLLALAGERAAAGDGRAPGE